MTRISRLTIPLLLLVSVSCGSSDDESTAVSTTDGAPPSAPATEQATDTTVPDVTTTASDPADAAIDEDPDASRTEFCGAYLDVADAADADPSVVGPELLRRVDALVESAPVEIEPDVATFADAFTRVADQQTTAGDGFDAQEELDALLETPEFSGSFESIIDYFVSSCDIPEPGDGGGASEIDPDALIRQLSEDPETAPWASDLRVLVFGGRGVKLFTSLDVDDAVTLCTTTLDLALEIDPEASVSVQSDAVSDDGETEVVVEGDGDGCMRV